MNNKSRTHAQHKHLIEYNLKRLIRFKINYWEVHYYLSSLYLIFIHIEN